MLFVILLAFLLNLIVLLSLLSNISMTVLPAASVATVQSITVKYPSIS